MARRGQRRGESAGFGLEALSVDRDVGIERDHAVRGAVDQRAGGVRRALRSGRRVDERPSHRRGRLVDTLVDVFVDRLLADRCSD